MTAAPVRWPAVLTQLLHGEDLSESQACEVLGAVMRGEAEPAQVSALLIALRAKGESGAEIAGFVRSMLDEAEPLLLDDHLAGSVVDTCGTGGDGAGTFNISTVAALVVAATGRPVAKHGNRAASGTCGSADLLEAWGVAIDLPPPQVATCLDELGIGFLYARSFHPAMRHVAGVRVQLGIRTVFNLLGPLSNPAGVKRLLVGVFAKRWIEPMAQVLGKLGAEKAWVVHGSDGLDELTTTGPTHVAALEGGKVTTFEVEPGDAGLPRARAEELKGGDGAFNAEAMRAMLGGAAGPFRDIVCYTAGAALIVAGKAQDLKDGVAQAASAIDSGKASAALNAMVAVTNAGAGGAAGR